MIAVFGGTFDPFHRGHLHVISHVLKILNPHQLMIIPAYQNPHKNLSGTEPSQRVAMTKIGTRELKDPRVIVSPIEAEAPHTSYTVETLCGLNAKESLTLVMGSDTAINFHKWKEPQRILEMANVLIIKRGAFDFAEFARKLGLTFSSTGEITTNKGHSTRLVDIGAIECSATRLRSEITKNLETNLECPPHIQPAVWEFIKVNKLYTDHELIVN